MKQFIYRYVTENWQDLVHLDLKIARLLGVPAPNTISSYAYLDTNWAWKTLHFVTDKLALWLFQQPEHCRQDFIRVTENKPLVPLE